MNIGALSQYYYATALANNSAAGLFGANQAQMALANSATGYDSPASVASMAQMDKALAFRGEMDKTNMQAAWAMQQSAKMQLEKEEKARRQLMADGATLV